jgi:hypothetical protein
MANQRQNTCAPETTGQENWCGPEPTLMYNACAARVLALTVTHKRKRLALAVDDHRGVLLRTRAIISKQKKRWRRTWEAGLVLAPAVDDGVVEGQRRRRYGDACDIRVPHACPRSRTDNPPIG